MKQAHLDADLDRFVEADLAFHTTLFNAVDNVFIDALFEPLTAVLRALRAATSAVPEIREHAIDWHLRVLAAVVESDPALAREAMRGHLMQTEVDADHYLTPEDQAVATSAVPG